MTNSTKLVSVPRKLLEEILKRLNVNQNHALCLNICSLLDADPAEDVRDPFLNMSALQQARLIHAMEAEDVRAVVDERISGPNWQACWTDWLANHAEIDPDGFQHHWNGWKAALHATNNSK
ncbi:hypothetical protein [Pseudomonas petrae]|uniref:Uncharacterized protein n=1 Tax=Pseudomonas petrae TaxID=2912190 RepID=A0ABS9I3C6_9PSED|nr:hypothetical protein [Pseudomonas petrae]MCF7541859.1 hypothetical protein [Pseudomonas petrae]